MAILSVQEISAKVGGELIGSPAVTIEGLERLDLAQPGQLTFIGDEKHARLWAASGASAALVSRNLLDLVQTANDGRPLIVVPSSDLAMAQVLAMFAPPPPTAGMPAASPATAIHPRAIIDPSARLGAGVRIGANCVIGPGVVIGDRTVIYPGVVILDNCQLGDDCILWPGVVIGDRCTLGHRCIVHPNVTIGADGFGYRSAAGGPGLIKIPQIGIVQIGSDVELGACTCIDRGKFSATVVGDGCKIDNLCQIGHNCRIGRHVVIAGNVGIAGSATIGDGAMIGGGAGIGDHVTIGAGAQVMAATGVMRDVAPGEKVAGTPAREARQFFREFSALSRLPEALRQLRSEK